MTPKLWLVRLLVVLTAVSGIYYLSWRWTSSVHWSVWWIAVPLVLAESYSLIDSLLFGLTMWRLRRRPEPGAAPEGLSVDVFITVYNEPVDLLTTTVRAAKQIRYPHETYILDDGNRDAVRTMAAAEGVHYLDRSDDWVNRPRHAKAGNLNNALMVTNGEFVLILDADQVPSPNILDRTLGYFVDEQVALVQTQQFFTNVSGSDPLGSQAPLFYGPIQQGKDGWNAAFFCGSNAVLRREALMRLGVSRYVRDLEKRIDQTLAKADAVIRKARKGLTDADLDAALGRVAQHVRDARTSFNSGAALAEITVTFQRQVALVARDLVRMHADSVRSDLAELGDSGDADVVSLDDVTLDRLSRRDWSPLAAIEAVRILVARMDVDREDEAQPVMPMSVVSVTEDMATCMRLHAAGWKTVYHHETLCLGLAPEDLQTMLKQRLRWAQGTMQVMLRENPVVQRGLSVGQRLMYLATMWSYLSGLAALAYIAAPVLFLTFGVLPVHAFSGAFFIRLVPFLVINQVLFYVVGRGRRTWRGQQYSLALFPVWIRAVTSAFTNVVLGRNLSFAVTSKTRQVSAQPWRLVLPQLIAMSLLVAAAAAGVVRWSLGAAAPLSTAINLVWVAFDLALFSVVIRAVRYQGFVDGAVADIPVEDAGQVEAITTSVPAVVPISTSSTTSTTTTSTTMQETRS